jgi:hypothetical protein
MATNNIHMNMKAIPLILRSKNSNTILSVTKIDGFFKIERIHRLFLLILLNILNEYNDNIFNNNNDNINSNTIINISFCSYYCN